MKTCPHCGKLKDESEFYLHRVNGKIYIHSWCKDCENGVARSKRLKEKKPRKEYDNTGRLVYHIIYDPENTWGDNPQFTLWEFRYMLNNKFLSPGTLVKYIPTNIKYKVISDGKHHTIVQEN